MQAHGRGAPEAGAQPCNQLRQVRKLDEYRRGREHIFQSHQSLQWFVRQHRDKLIESGALVLLTGQWHAVDDKFDAYVLEAGRAAARSHAVACA